MQFIVIYRFPAVKVGTVLMMLILQVLHFSARTGENAEEKKETEVLAARYRRTVLLTQAFQWHFMINYN